MIIFVRWWVLLLLLFSFFGYRRLFFLVFGLALCPLHRQNFRHHRASIIHRINQSLNRQKIAIVVLAIFMRCPIKHKWGFLFWLLKHLLSLSDICVVGNAFARIRNLISSAKLPLCHMNCLMWIVVFIKSVSSGYCLCQMSVIASRKLNWFERTIKRYEFTTARKFQCTVEEGIR